MGWFLSYSYIKWEAQANVSAFCITFEDESDKDIIGIAFWMKSPNILQNLTL